MAEVQTGQDGAYEASAVAEESAKVDAARADLVDEATQSAPPQEGELILGKYKSVDDLASAYQSLQSEYTKLKGSESTPAPAPDAVSEKPQVAPPQDRPEESTPDADAPKVTVQDAERIRGRMMEQIGGEEKYQAVAGWASQNLPQERLAAFNNALKQGDEAQIVNQLKGLQYDYMMATGYEPRLTGGRAPSNSVQGFSSESQVVEAMKDPRYSGTNPDPAYVKEIEQRIAASNVFTPR